MMIIRNKKASFFPSDALTDLGLYKFLLLLILGCSEEDSVISDLKSGVREQFIDQCNYANRDKEKFVEFCTCKADHYYENMTLEEFKAYTDGEWVIPIEGKNYGRPRFPNFDQKVFDEGRDKCNYKLEPQPKRDTSGGLSIGD